MMSSPAPVNSDTELIEKLREILAITPKDAPIKDFPKEKYLEYLNSLKIKEPPAAVKEVKWGACCWSCKKGV